MATNPHVLPCPACGHTGLHYCTGGQELHEGWSSAERRSRPRGNPNWTPGRDTGQLGNGKYGERRTMVVRIPCEALERVATICREYEVQKPTERPENTRTQPERNRPKQHETT